MDIANKKISNLQTDSNHHDQEIGYIKDMLEESKNNEGDKNGEENNGEDSGNMKSSDFNDLKKRVDELDARQRKDVRSLQE